MAPRHHLIGVKVALLLIFGILAGILFARGGLTSEAGHLSPVPSFHVDIGDIPPTFIPTTATGNTYAEDPNSDGDASDQLMSVPPISACASRTITNFASVLQIRVVTDIIMKNADEMLGADARINFDPNMIQFVSFSIIPFAGGPITGQPVGLLNLPVDPLPAGTHATASPASAINNTDGAVFLGGTYQGFRTFARSTESGPTIDGGVSSLPNRNAGQAPNGGVFVRILWNLQPGSSGQDVVIDLTRGGPMFTGGTSAPIISQGSDFFALLTPDPGFGQEQTLLGGADLFDGIISVNKASPDPCPPVHDIEAKGIGGTKNSSDLKLFKTCLRTGQDPCTTTQNHHLMVVNNSDHTENIPVKYEVVGWPPAGTTCTVNGALGGGPILLLNTVETGVPTNASRNITVPVTFSCPAGQAGAVVGTDIQLRLTTEHTFSGSNDNDADPSNDIFIKSKTIK